jgi:arylsulfatase A-like enzyme
MRAPNILLIVLDATRADACSCYGDGPLTTPVLDEMVEQGVLFEQAISPAPWTLPAMASIFTGLFPSQTNVYDKLALTSYYPTLAQLLSQNGYATFGITNNSWLSAGFGLQNGFDQVHKQWQGWQTRHEVNNLVLLQKSQHSNWTRMAIQELSQGNLLKNLVNAAYNKLLAYRRDLGASRILHPLTRWIESQERPWFAFVHYLESHLEYKPPSQWVTRFMEDSEQTKKWLQADQWRAAWRHIAGVELLSEADLRVWRELYRAEVAYADYHLGQLLDWLARTNRLESTLIAVVADHGENLGEHGLLNHQYCVYDTLLRVPLVMRCPALLPQGLRIPYQVQTLDLFKTLLDLVGVEAPPSSSRDMFRESDRRPFTVAEYGTPRTPHPRYLTRYGLTKGDLGGFERGLVTIRTDTHKLIIGTDGSRELYAWREDPKEECNLASEHPEMVADLTAMLQSWREEMGASLGECVEDGWNIDPETASRLEALGYLG